MQPMNSPSELAQNMPNNSLMYQTYTPTFGNIMFQIAPSQTGQVNLSNGTVPYVSLESMVYMQQMQAQTNQVNTQGRAVTGQNNVTGAITTKDGTGNIRVAISGGGQNANQITGGF
jgi:hypothetical protein